MLAIERAGLSPGNDVAISLDIAASEFGRDGRYTLALDGRELDRDQMAAMLIDWLDRYPIVSIEDPFAEDDRVAWIRFGESQGGRVQIVGDDYLTTSAEHVDRAAIEHACNAVLVKPNQAGTLTEARAALDAGRRHRFGTIVSARSGETEDVTIAHLAVGWNAGQLKVGSFARSERMAKWNEVLRIEEAMGANAAFAGAAALRSAGRRACTASRRAGDPPEAAFGCLPPRGRRALGTARRARIPPASSRLRARAGSPPARRSPRRPRRR